MESQIIISFVELIFKFRLRITVVINHKAIPIPTFFEFYNEKQENSYEHHDKKEVGLFTNAKIRRDDVRDDVTDWFPEPEISVGCFFFARKERANKSCGREINVNRTKKKNLDVL